MSMLEFLLRYTVIIGTVIASVGAGLCFLAKPLTQNKRGTKEISKDDRYYMTFMLIGVCLILIGMIIIALPIESTFYKG